MISVNPGLILVLGALVVPLLRGNARGVAMLALSLAGLAYSLLLPSGGSGPASFLDFDLVLLRVDPLARAFGGVFFVAAALAALFGFQDRDPIAQTAALVYAGGAIGAVFAGDLITLFVFWELTAISSVFLVWAGGTERAYRAGLRYLIVQVGSGVILLAGLIIHAAETGSVAFDHLGLAGPGPVLILVAIGIKCAFPLLHAWLADAYPEASPAGTVWLSAFTTKLAVYALARGYAGTEILIWIGAVMTVFPIVYAVLADDLRRVLAHSLNIQLGFMVAAIGVGGAMAINGAVAHALGHILYKALLFMTIGAVLTQSGTAKASDLGGLWRSMPWTAACCVVGAASISAVPLFSGYASKSLILAVVAGGGHFVPWLLLLTASAGVIAYAGVKVPYAAFFAPDRGLRCSEAPWNMRLAMAIAAVACIAMGALPQMFYSLLPYPVSYDPYTVDHVVGQLQLLLFAALALVVLQRAGLYPWTAGRELVDVDILYRRGLPALARWFVRSFGPIDRAVRRITVDAFRRLVTQIYRHQGPAGALTRTANAGNMVFWVMVMLAGYLVIYFV